MPDDRSSLSLTKFIAAIIFGMGLLAASVVFGVNYAVDRAVSIDARTKADDWAKYFINTLPDLDRLLANGKLDGHQASVVSTAAKVGNVFRFKLYDAKGNTILESDAETFEKKRTPTTSTMMRWMSSPASRARFRSMMAPTSATCLRFMPRPMCRC